MSTQQKAQTSQRHPIWERVDDFYSKREADPKVRREMTRAYQPPCEKCNGTGTELVPGKGARACKCRRRRRKNVIDLQSYRTANTAVSGMDAIRDAQEEADRVQRELDNVLTFFEGHTPDFITNAVVDAIWEACARVGIESPDYEDDLETRAILKALFSKTKMLDLRPRESA